MTNSRKKGKPAGAASPHAAVKPPTNPAAAPTAAPSPSLPVRDSKKRKGRRYAKKAKKPVPAPNAALTAAASSASAALPAPSSRAALIAKRKESLSSLARSPVSQPPSSTWRRVELNPELLSHSVQRSELGGILTLEEIDGAVFKSQIATYDPKQRYGAEGKEEEGGQQPAAKRRKTAAQRRLTREKLVPALEHTATTVEDSEEEREEEEKEQSLEEQEEEEEEEEEGTAVSADPAPNDEEVDKDSDAEGDVAVQDEADDAEAGEESKEETEGVEFFPADLSDTEVDEATQSATAEAQRILSDLHSSLPPLRGLRLPSSLPHPHHHPPSRPSQGHPSTWPSSPLRLGYLPAAPPPPPRPALPLLPHADTDPVRLHWPRAPPLEGCDRRVGDRQWQVARLRPPYPPSPSLLSLPLPLPSLPLPSPLSSRPHPLPYP